MPKGAFCHRLQLVSDFLKKKNIKMLDWFGNSPDFNPIEKWATLKDKVADQHATSDKDMEMAIKQIWMQKIKAEYCKHLLYNMPCCLQVVIKNKNGHTK